MFFKYNKWTHTEQHLYGAERLGMHVLPDSLPAAGSISGPIILGETLAPKHRYCYMAKKRYELSNHLGNVMGVVTDRRFVQNGSAFAIAEVVSATDYYPFGMEMPGWVFAGSRYVFGFNGKIEDTEILPNGRWQDYGFRAYRPDICRFVSVDPLKGEYPWYTPYQFAGNMPVSCIDIDGLEPGYSTLFHYIFKYSGVNNSAAQEKVIDRFKNTLDKTTEVGKDIVVITGGATTIIVAAPVEGVAVVSAATVFTIAVGVTAIGGGATKLYYHLSGNNDAADEVPTSISGSVLVTANWTMGQRVFSKSFVSTVELTEGIVTLDLSNFTELPIIGKSDEAINSLALLIDVSELPQKFVNDWARSGVPFESLDSGLIDSDPRKQMQRDNTNTNVDKPIKNN